MSKKLNIQEHFTVPEGYFEQFSEQFMNNLPEQPHQKMNIRTSRIELYKRHSRYASIAAVFLGVIALGALEHFFVTTDKEDLKNEFATVEHETTDTNAKEIADYAMYDSQDIHSMLAQE